jgi:hypothetical protein
MIETGGIALRLRCVGRLACALAGVVLAVLSSGCAEDDPPFAGGYTPTSLVITEPDRRLCRAVDTLFNRDSMTITSAQLFGDRDELFAAARAADDQSLALRARRVLGPPYNTRADATAAAKSVRRDCADRGIAVRLPAWMET